MATFFFDTITDAEALAYSGATDLLIFPSGMASQVAVNLNSPLVLGKPTVGLTFGARSLTINNSYRGEVDSAFPDSSLLFAGTTGNDSRAGSAGPDGMYGGTGDDSITGLGGADVLQGNQGNDTLVGGAGVDSIYGGQGNDRLETGTDDNNYAQATWVTTPWLAGPTMT